MTDHRIAVYGFAASMLLQIVAIVAILLPSCGGDESHCYVDTPHDGRVEVQCPPENAWTTPPKGSH